MEQNQNFDFKAGPAKRFIDTAHLRIMDGLLHINLESGSESHTFLFPLPLAKKIAKILAQQIGEIEQRNGVTFDDRLPTEPMLSPVTIKPRPDNEEGTPPA